MVMTPGGGRVGTGRSVGAMVGALVIPVGAKVIMVVGDAVASITGGGVGASTGA